MNWSKYHLYSTQKHVFYKQMKKAKTSSTFLQYSFSKPFRSELYKYSFSNSFRSELENEFFKIIFTHGIIYKITWYKQDIEVPAYALVSSTLFNLWIEKVYIDLEKLSLTNYKKEDSADHTREKFDNSVSEMEKKTNKIHKKINLNCFGNNTMEFKFRT